MAVDPAHIKSLDEKLRKFSSTLSPEESEAFRQILQQHGQGASDEALRDVAGGEVSAEGEVPAMIASEAGVVVNIQSR